MPMPVPEWRFVVIGLTNGPAMTRNPCLAEQLAWAKKHDVLVSAYAVATYPSDAQLAEHGATGPYDASTTAGKLSNWGYAQAVFNLQTLYDVQLAVPGLGAEVMARVGATPVNLPGAELFTAMQSGAIDATGSWPCAGGLPRMTRAGECLPAATCCQERQAGWRGG